MSSERFPFTALAPSAARGLPFYRQIADALRREVAAGRLTAGSALPSFRELAEGLLVSLITVKRAYEELEQDGVIYRHQGIGTFVAEGALAAAREAARVAVDGALSAALAAAREAGMADGDVVALLRQKLSAG